MGDTGGNSMTEDVNAAFNSGDMTWVMVAACMVWLMVPGIGIFYAGLARKKHAITLVWEGFAVMALVSFEWFFWGYSFVFSHEAGDIFGKLDNFSLMKVLAAPSVGSSSVPDIVFAFFQGQFACVFGILVLGGAHERARLGPLLLYTFLIQVLVYNFVAEWTWNPKGWLSQLGALDYAGGGPVHLASGSSALAYALVCGRRKDPASANTTPQYKPGSMLLVALGTLFLWFGWFGFNGGSAGNATIRAWYSIFNTNLAASVGALVWMLMDYVKVRKWSMVGICSGAVAGLVGITPAAGFVPVYTAVAIGAITAAAANLGGYVKYWIRIDDGLDVFSIHGIGGAVGSICTSLFAADYIARLDGSTEIPGGWMSHHYVQLPYQLAAIGSIFGWAFTVSALILLLMQYTPFVNRYLHIRMSEEDELRGSDMAQLAEYGMLYEIKSHAGNQEGLFAMGTHDPNSPMDDTYNYREASSDHSTPPTSKSEVPKPETHENALRPEVSPVTVSEGPVHPYAE